MQSHSSGLPSRHQDSQTKPWSESQVIDIELSDFQIAEVNPIEVLFNLFKSDVFAPKDLTNEDATLMPADVSCIVHTPSLEVSRIDIGLCVARQQPCAWSIKVSRCLMVERFMRSFIVIDATEFIETLLLCTECWLKGSLCPASASDASVHADAVAYRLNALMDNT